jgi:deoxyribose-phosphate aldolase
MNNYDKAFSAGAKAPTVDFFGIRDRLERVSKRSIKNETKMEGLRLALSMIDLTTLEGQDTSHKVLQLCEKAKRLHLDAPELTHVAAVCVYPEMVATAAKALKGTGIKVASVATAFPSGQASIEVKRADTQQALESGADEIDMVISRGKFHSGNYAYVFDEISEIKSLCGHTRLKVILETGELGTLDRVRLASDIAIKAGADFIKTSTGKIGKAATLPVTLVMLEAIRDYYYHTGKMIGMKPAGGISNAKLALQYLVLLNETLGAKWMTPEWFRFGASSLANDLLMQYMKQKTGVYQSAEYFTIA